MHFTLVRFSSNASSTATTKVICTHFYIFIPLWSGFLTTIELGFYSIFRDSVLFACIELIAVHVIDGLHC